MGKGSSQNQNQNKGKGKSKGQTKGKTKSKGKGQWTTWPGQSWSCNQGQGGKGKGKGPQVCSHCGRKGHSVDPGGLLKLVLQDLVQGIKDKYTISQVTPGSFRLNHAHRSAQRISGPQASSSATTTSQSALFLTTIIFISGVLGLCLWPRSRIQCSPAQNQPLHIKRLRRLHHGGQLQQSHL